MQESIHAVEGRGHSQLVEAKIELWQPRGPSSLCQSVAHFLENVGHRNRRDGASNRDKKHVGLGWLAFCWQIRLRE